MSVLGFRREVDRAAATMSAGESIILLQHEENKSLTSYTWIEDAPEPVQKESKSVGDYIAQFFRFLLGLFFPCCMGKSDDAQPEPAHFDRDSSPRPCRVVTPPKVEKKRRGPAFPAKASEVFISDHLQRHEHKRLTEDKVAALAAYEGYGKLIATAKGRLAELEDLIPKVKAMSYWERRDANLPSSRDLIKEKTALEVELREYEQETLRGYDGTFSQLESDINTVFIQHPRFGEVLRSPEGFPFKLIFDGEELAQAYSYSSARVKIPRNDYTFQRVIGQKLKGWSKEKDIDPVGLNIAAQAQLVLVHLAKDSGPLVIDFNDRELKPQTVPGTVVVNFESEGGRPVMRVEREVKTEDGKRYRWIETVCFDGARPLATRKVTEKK